MLHYLGFYRLGGVSEAHASIANINGQDVLVVDGQDHPPWAQSHVVDADIDYDNHTITVVERFMVLSPFGVPPNRGWPLVLNHDRLPESKYTVQYWSGERKIVLGQLIVSERSMELVHDAMNGQSK
ncbi:MAG: hypothetical protein IT443_03850 [Phycisphaeraceae bacterium]|nr:hypothetical protein [Phycisphaeraceae bacterium]